MTEEVMQELYSEGYTHIWTSACQTGNHDYISNYTTYTERYLCNDTDCWSQDQVFHNDTHYIEWPDYVDRNKNPGKTIPVFVGLGVIRVTTQ